MAENKNITVTGTTDTRTLDNSKLIEAIQAMRALGQQLREQGVEDVGASNEFKQAQNVVINEALRATFLVPALVETSQELVADANNRVKFQDKQTAKFVLINHKERGSFFPCFTSAAELNKLQSEQKFRPFSMKFGDIAGLTEQTPQVNGFVINPFNENLPFTKDMLASIKQTLIRINQERAAAQKAAEAGEAQGSGPDITVSSGAPTEE